MAAIKPYLVGLAATTLLCVSASAYAEGPIALADGQLDQVTAGLALGVTTAALAGGGVLALTNTQGVVTGSTTKLPRGGNEQTGVAGGTATAIAPGGSAETGAASAGSVTGHTLVNTNIHGTVAGIGGSLSVGFTYVTGGTVVP